MKTNSKTVRHGLGLIWLCAGILAAGAAETMVVDFNVELGNGDDPDTEWEVQVGEYGVSGREIVSGSFESGTITVLLRKGVEYDLKFVAKSGAWIAGGSVAFTNLFCFEDNLKIERTCPPSCTNAEWVDVTTAHVFEVEPVHTSSFKFYLTGTFPYLTFDSQCGDDDLPYLVADGQSTAKTTIMNNSLEPPINWTIEGDNLGCSIDTNGVVTAGRRNGTIVVRASDGDNCYVRGMLDLVGGITGCASQMCGGPGGMTIGNGRVTLSSIDVEISLGQSSHGRSAGMIEVHADTPSTNLYMPACLAYAWKDRRDVHIVRDTNNHIKQIKVPQGLANVVTVSDDSFLIYFYRPSAIGLWTTNGYSIDTNYSPFATWTFENPDAAATNRLQITQPLPGGGGSIVNIYTWITNGWELDIEDGSRFERLSISWVTNTNPVRIEGREFWEGGNPVVAYRTNKYELLTVGTAQVERLVEEIKGTGDDQLINTYTYYDTGQLKQASRHDGSWEYYVYDSQGRPTNVLSAYLSQEPTTNRSLCRAILYDYTPVGDGDDGTYFPDRPRKVVQTIEDQIVGLSYHVYYAASNLDIVCLETNAPWNDSDNLVTTQHSYSDGLFGGKPKKTFYPDGTATFYEYYQGVNRTNIVLHGEPNAEGTNIVSGTKTVTITGPVGEMITRTETWVSDSTEIAQTAGETYSNYDDYQRPQTVTYQDGTSTGVAYACCGTQTMTDRDGVTTTNVYNALNRLEKTIRAGITNSFTYDAAGNLLTQTRSAGGSSITLAQMRYDTAGRLLYKTNALDEVVSYSEVFTNGLLVKTVNFTEGVSKVEKYHRDGSLASFINENESGFTNYYGVDSTTGWTYVKQVKLNSIEDETDEWTATYRDLAGRLAKIEYAASSSPYPAHQYLYSGKGQLAQELDPDGVSTLYLYTLSSGH